jgi:hypothetical protein
MKIVVLILALLLILSAKAQTLKIAVIDSGLDINDPRLSAHICPTGHRDFTGEGLQDIHGHGTEVVGLIEKNAGNGDYCIVVYKYFQESAPGSVNLTHEVEALVEATRNNIKLVNLSSGGPHFNEKEYLAIKGNPSTLFIVAAGNDGKNLNTPGDEYYPASYGLPNILPVGSTDDNGKRSSFSNYGRVISSFEIGNLVDTTLIEGHGPVSGTSFSTAVRTGKVIKGLLNANK